LQIASNYDFRENRPNISAAITIHHTPALISYNDPFAVTAYHTPAKHQYTACAIPRPDFTRSLTYFGFFHSARQQIPTYQKRMRPASTIYLRVAIKERKTPSDFAMCTVPASGDVRNDHNCNSTLPLWQPLPVQSIFNVQSQDAITEVGMYLQINSLFNAAYFNSVAKNKLRSRLSQFYWMNFIIVCCN
jgi:hypothetical protein